MDSLVPDGDYDLCEDYLNEFLGHLRTDHRRWPASGANAEWTLGKGRTEAGVCRAHFEDAPI
jgi:hypothetical protein